jgi:putative FmdB family regulatory protein
MPVFEYRCVDCNKKYEILHLTKEKTEDIICPSCGSKNFVKLLSRIAKPVSEDSDFDSSDFSSDDSDDYSGSTCCSGGACSCN